MPEDELLKELPGKIKTGEVKSNGETYSSLPAGTKILGVQENEVRNPYQESIKREDGLSKIDEIVNNLPEMPGDHESKKAIFKDLALRRLPQAELSNSLLTLQGKHPHQEGGSKYYLDEKGIPIPLKNDERPPTGNEVASIWGGKEDARDDNWATDLAKTVFNILPAAAENVVDLAQTGYEAVMDESSDALNSLKNAANYLKFEKDPDTQKPMLNTEGIDEFSDILDSKRWDFSPETLWGTTQGLLGSVGEMFIGGSAVAKGIKGAKALNEGYKGIKGVTELGKKAAWAATYAGSYMTNLGEARDAAEQAGLEGRDKATFSALVTAPIAAIDAKFDLGGKILSNKLLQEEKNAFIKTIAQNVVARTAEGKLTKEAVDGLAKATTVGYSQLAKKWSSQTLTDVLEQGGEEAAQAFMQNAGEQLWDKLTDEEKKKFGTDALSPESFAEYLQNGLAGMVGGAPTAFAFNKVKEAAKKESQSNTAFGVATKGEEAVKAFKYNVANEVQNGKLTPEEAKNANFQVDAYHSYNQQIQGSEIGDEDKKRVFDLTFQKQNLESQIPTDYEEGKMNGIEQAQINTKKKQAKEIQGEIDSILHKGEVQSTTETIAKKTAEDHVKSKETEVEKQLKKYGIKTTKNETDVKPISDEEYNHFVDTGEVHEDRLSSIAEKVIKQEDISEQEKAIFTAKTPEVEHLIKTGFTDKGYKLHESIRSEPRSYDEIDNAQWNDKKFSAPVKLFKLAQKLFTLHKKQEFGIIEQDYNDGEIDTFRVKLPDGKTVRFASSMKRKPTKEEVGGYRGHTYEENFDKRENPIGAKVGVKVHKLDESGRMVISIFNAEPGPKYGKHLGFVKERQLGNSTFNAKDEKQLGEIQDSKEGGDEEGTIIETNPAPIAPEVTKESELKQIKKPSLKLNFITKSEVLSKKIKTTITESESGEEVETDMKVGKIQAAIKKKLAILESLTECVHG